MGEPVRDWEKIREALPVVLGESLAVGDWLGASDAPAPVIAAQERVAAAVQELGVLLSALAQARARNEEHEAREAVLTEALREADDLLLRLSGWDVLNMPPGSHDGPRWQQEIAAVRKIIGVEQGDTCEVCGETIRVCRCRGRKLRARAALVAAEPSGSAG